MTKKAAIEFRLTGGDLESGFISRALKLGEDYNRIVMPDKLRKGDLFNSDGELFVITDIEDAIYARGERGKERGFDLEHKKVIKRMPVELCDWVFFALDGEKADGYLYKNKCWKCNTDGWAFMLNLPSMLVSTVSELFCYKGVIRQLRNHFTIHQDQRTKFGRVKKRHSRTLGTDYISQGCHKCDSLWGDVPMSHIAASYLPYLEEHLEGGTAHHTFTLDVMRLFDEGTLKG